MPTLISGTSLAASSGPVPKNPIISDEGPNLGSNRVIDLEFNIGSAPNVECGKMRSEWVECALERDLRGTRSAFYFY
jgi:hypothetical protein